MKRRQPEKFLVTTQWLADHLHKNDIQLFDCTAYVDKHYKNNGLQAHYLQHHIPGAAYLDIGSVKGEFTNPESDIPFCWPEAADIIPTIKKHGINPNKKIILYSGPNPTSNDSGISWSTRAWWILHSYGFDCAIVDGGWKKWTQEGRPTSNQTESYPALDTVTLPAGHQLVAHKSDVVDHLAQGLPLVDSLSDASFNGKVDSRYGKFGLRCGHITGAYNVHYEAVLDPADNTFISPEKIHDLLTHAGVNLKQPIITYCGGGIGATVTGFAFLLAGIEDIRIYDGSLMEWCNDLRLPMTNHNQE